MWNAVQPALQMASKVLYLDHPFWQAILDIEKLASIDPARIPPHSGRQDDWETDSEGDGDSSSKARSALLTPSI